MRARVTLALFVVFLTTACPLGRTSPCLPIGDIVNTGQPRITLTELTSPAAGRNITASSREDRITAVLEPLPEGAEQLEIRLVTPQEMTWWKAIELRRGPRPPGGCVPVQAGTSVAMAETQDQRHTATLLLRNDLASTTTLVLWKAKFAGVHTPMYQLSGNLTRLRGQRLIITWEQE
jgi:hypothetical protein